MTAEIPDSDCDQIIQVERWFDGDILHDSPLQVAIQDGLYVASGSSLDLEARQTIQSGGILLGRVTDLHAHPDPYLSVFGVDPDTTSLPSGVHRVISQGDAGALALDSFIERIVEGRKTQVGLAINISKFGETRHGGAIQDLEDADVDLCLQAVRRKSEHVVAISVNASCSSCVNADPQEVLRRAIDVATELQLPLLYGLRQDPDWSLARQLELLRAGDIVTYCFRRTPHCIVTDDGVLPEIRDARQRGICFDVGHGCQSFDFEVAEIAFQSGFLPDTISTDLQRGHLGSHPTHTLPLVASKMMSVGMPLVDVLRAITRGPAMILPYQPAAAFETGQSADCTVFTISSEEQILTDCSGNQRWSQVIKPEIIFQKGQRVL